MSHTGNNFPGRNYSQVNILQRNLSSLHWLLKLPHPPSIYLALVHFSRRPAKDAYSSPFCRQRLSSRPEHCKLETGQQPQAQANTYGLLPRSGYLLPRKREVVRRSVWVRNPKEQESKMKPRRRNGTARVWKT